MRIENSMYKKIVIFLCVIFLLQISLFSSTLQSNQQDKAWLLDHSKIDFNKKEKSYLNKKKIIKMCIDPEWMPYEGFNKKGQYVGISADFFKIFQKEIGIPFQVIKTKSWTESLAKAKARECDILSLALEIPDRKKYLNFTTPYLNMPLVLATKPNVVFFDDFQVLKDKKIGIVKGYAFNEIIRKKYPNFKVVDVKNIDEGLSKVVSGELFGYIGTLPSIGYMFQTRYIGELKIAGKFNEKWKLSIGVRNDQPLLLDILEKAVNNVPNDVKQKIIFKTIAINYVQHMDYLFIAEILAAVFIVMAFILYHNRKLARMNKQLKELQNKLLEQAHRDPMTNLYNRRYFHEVSSTILQIAQRENSNISLIMIDIDNFKLINDTYGHAIGDEVIKKLAQLLQDNVRLSDVVCRFGGEEFVILLPDTDIKGAQKIASKIREVVEKNTLFIEKKSIKFTISLGVASLLSHTDNIESILKRADKALYEAKESGKNKTVVYRDGMNFGNK
jgi:polar amino acid transport system substrate-binding protein